MKKTILTILTSLITLGAAAIPAQPGTFTFTQSDGTTITLRMVGDEHFHYFINVDNGRTMLRADGGDFYYVTDATLAPMRAAADTRRAAANSRRTARLAKRFETTATTAPALHTDGPARVPAGEFNGAMTGSKKGLVILMDFPDLKFQSHNNRAAYERVFNQEGYNEYGSIGSVHDYFKDQSYGQFDLTFDVVGPYTADNDMSYYGTDMAFPNDPYGWGKIQDLKACLLPIEAVQKADPDVNFKDYDWDGDGEVDQVYIIYPGYAQSSGAPANTIWPHESNLSQWAQYNSNFGPNIPTVSIQRCDGVKIDTYAMSQELTGTSGNTRVGIGTACHEFAHCLGFPDVYDINQKAFGMEAFDLMDNGGYNGPSYNCEVPAGFTAYERWMSGWLEPTVLSEGCAVTDMAALNDKGEAYVVYNSGNSNEYLLIENRQPKGWHKYVRQWTIPGGLLVTHVDFDKTAWRDNKVNVDPSHQRLTLVPAGKSYGTQAMGYLYTYESDYRSMLFPGSKEVTELSDDSHYANGMKTFNRTAENTYKFGAALHEIKIDDTKGTASFIYNDGPDDGNRWQLTFVVGATGSLTASGNGWDATTWTQTRQNEPLALPTATTTADGWNFLGWATDRVATTETRPEGLLEGGTMFKPTADATFYAVYGYSEVTGAADDYTLVGSPRGGADYVFCNKDKETDVAIYAFNALALNPNVGEIVAKPSGKAVDVDFTGTAPTIHAPAANLVWTSEISDQGIAFKNDGLYLAITANGFGYTAQPTYLGWTDNFGLYGNVGGTKYYVRISSGKWQVNTVGNATSRIFLYENAPVQAILFGTDTELPQAIAPITPAAPAAATYDLTGRRVATPAAHGITIQAGRRILR